MDMRYNKGENIEFVYPARGGSSGLTDVTISIYRTNGDVIKSATMTEVGSTGIYTFKWKAPPYERTYISTINSASKPMKRVDVIVVGDVKRTGGFVQKVIPQTLSKEDRRKLIEGMKDLAEIKNIINNIGTVTTDTMNTIRSNDAVLSVPMETKKLLSEDIRKLSSNMADVANTSTSAYLSIKNSLNDIMLHTSDNKKRIEALEKDVLGLGKTMGEYIAFLLKKLSSDELEEIIHGPA